MGDKYVLNHEKCLDSIRNSLTPYAQKLSEDADITIKYMPYFLNMVMLSRHGGKWLNPTNSDDCMRVLEKTLEYLSGCHLTDEVIMDMDWELNENSEEAVRESYQNGFGGIKYMDMMSENVSLLVTVGTNISIALNQMAEELGGEDKAKTEIISVALSDAENV